MEPRIPFWIRAIAECGSPYLVMIDTFATIKLLSFALRGGTFSPGLTAVAIVLALFFPSMVLARHIFLEFVAKRPARWNRVLDRMLGHSSDRVRTLAATAVGHCFQNNVEQSKATFSKLKVFRSVCACLLSPRMPSAGDDLPWAAECVGIGKSGESLAEIAFGRMDIELYDHAPTRYVSPAAGIVINALLLSVLVSLVGGMIWSLINPSLLPNDYNLLVGGFIMFGLSIIARFLLVAEVDPRELDWRNDAFLPRARRAMTLLVISDGFRSANREQLSQISVEAWEVNLRSKKTRERAIYGLLFLNDQELMDQLRPLIEPVDRNESPAADTFLRLAEDS